MKLVTLCLALCAALAFAGSHSELGAVEPSGSGTAGAGTDALVFSQTYSFAALVNGFGHTVAADDFILSADASLQNIRIWMIYSSGNPTTYDLAIAQDAGDSNPGNASTVWSETVPCTHVDTGDDNWGFDIYETTCPISSYPSLTAGQRYWLILTFDTGVGTQYWLVEDPVWGSYCWTGDGTTWWRSDDVATFDYAADFFFELYDSPVVLERETWGSIKSIF